MNENQDNLSPRRSRFNFTNNRLTPTRTDARPTERERINHDKEKELKSISQPHLSGRKLQHTEKSGPLIFNVATLLSDPEGSHREYDYQQDRLTLSLEEGEKPAESTNIKGHIRLTHIRHDVLAQGQGEADVILECVRCLSDFDYHVNYDIEEVFRPSIDVATGLTVKFESLDEEEDLKLDANHLLNLGEAIRQQILVSLPIKPICGDDCPGLTDILDQVNQHTTIETVVEPEEEEAEDETPVDKRWSALSQLLKDEGDSN